MNAVFRSFLLMLATATDRALARQVQFLKIENQILRGKLPKRITVTPQERQRLIKYGRPLGAAIKHLIGIVSPRTFLRWLGAEQPSAPKPGQPGRPRTEAEIRDWSCAWLGKPVGAIPASSANSRNWACAPSVARRSSTS